MLRNSYRLPCVLLFALLLVGLPAAQATVIHTNVSGATVDFTAISEGSPTGDPEPLYGQPIAAVDTLVFPTTASFTANSIDGLGSDDTDGKLSLTIDAKPGYSMTTFNVSEGGLTTLGSPFGGDAFTSVIAFATVKVIEIDNSPVSLPILQSFLATSPLGGQYLLSAIGGSSYSTAWTGSLSLPLPAGTTKALVTVDNRVFATTLGGGSSAYIDKTAFEIGVDTVVPEPTTLLLGIVAIVGMVTVRRKSGL